MKAKEFIEQEKELMQVVPTPFAADAVKSEFMKKEAEFEYTGIEISDVKFSSEGTILTLQQEGKTATVTFSYADDVGPFAAVKPGQSAGESVNLDLTPLSPPVVETSIGKQVDVGNMSWMTVEAFEGIVSAAGMNPIEIDPTAPPDSLGSQGSGASTPTSELPQGQTTELDAKQVPAPAPRGGIPGESLYSDGKPRYYPGIKVSAIDEIGKKNEDPEQDVLMKCRDCDYTASDLEFMGDTAMIDDLRCPRCGSGDIEDAPEESLKEVKVPDVRDVFAKHQIKIAKDTLKMSDVGAVIMGGMTKEEAREILKKYGLLPKSEESLEEKENKKLLGYASGFVYYQMGDKVYRGDYADEHPHLSFYSNTKDFKIQLSDEEGNPVKVSEKSLYADGTSKYHPGLKQEAIHRVTWSKGKDVFVTDVEAGSEKEAGKKVKDSTRADKIVSVGKQVKEAKPKELNYFRFAIREGQRIKIPVGKVIKEENLMSENPKNGPKALIAFFKKFPDKKRKDYNHVFDHGHLWITGVDGDQYDVVDAEGPGTFDGFGFEQVSLGAEENLKTKKATEFLKRFGK